MEVRIAEQRKKGRRERTRRGKALSQTVRNLLGHGGRELGFYSTCNRAPEADFKQGQDIIHPYKGPSDHSAEEGTAGCVGTCAVDLYTRKHHIFHTYPAGSDSGKLGHVSLSSCHLFHTLKKAPRWVRGWVGLTLPLWLCLCGSVWTLHE